MRKHIHFIKELAKATDAYVQERSGKLDMEFLRKQAQ